VALEAVQVDQHGQLRPDPTTAGQLPALQGPAGEFGEGVGPALAAAAGVLGAVGAGEGVEGGQQELPGLGVQGAVDGEQAVEGGGQPQPPLLLLPVAVGGGGLGSRVSPRWARTRRSRGGSSR
jgi:hypothetical protein